MTKINNPAQTGLVTIPSPAGKRLMAPTKWGARQVKNLTAPSLVSGRFRRVGEVIKRLFLAVVGSFVTAATSPLYFVGTRLKKKQAPHAATPPVKAEPPIPAKTPTQPQVSGQPIPPQLEKKLDDFTNAISDLTELTPMSEEWKKQVEALNNNFIKDQKRGIPFLEKLTDYLSIAYGKDSYEYGVFTESKIIITDLINYQNKTIHHVQDTGAETDDHDDNDNIKPQNRNVNSLLVKKLEMMQRYADYAWESYVPSKFNKPLDELRQDFEAIATQIFDQKKPVALSQLKSFIDACNLNENPDGTVEEWEMRKHLQVFLPYLQSGGHIQVRFVSGKIPKDYSPIAASVKTHNHTWSLLKTIAEAPDLWGKISKIIEIPPELFEHPENLRRDVLNRIQWETVICVHNQIALELKKALIEFKNNLPLPWYGNKCMPIQAISLAMVAYRADQLYRKAYNLP